jgi:hypothetical protein
MAEIKPIPGMLCKISTRSRYNAVSEKFSQQLRLLIDLRTKKLVLLQQAVEALLHPAVPKPEAPERLEVALGPSASRFFQVYPVKSQLRLDAALGPYPIPDQLPAATDDLTVIKFLLTGHPHPLQHPFGQEMRQFTTVPSIGLDSVAVLLGNQTRGCDQAWNTVGHQAVMKPEAKNIRLHRPPSIDDQHIEPIGDTELPSSLGCWR